MCEAYLLHCEKNAIFEVLQHLDQNKHFSLNINFIELFDYDQSLGLNILKNPVESLEEWDATIQEVQTKLLGQHSEENLCLKKRVHCRIYSLPSSPDLTPMKFPLSDDGHTFLQITGTVIRVTDVKLLEYQRQYICPRCKYQMFVKADYCFYNTINSPKRCGNVDCNSTNLVALELNTEFCKDYQEIKLQETMDKLNEGSIPDSMWVTLDDDLVQVCKPGDNITVSGVLKRRYRPLVVGKPIEVELVMKANHIEVNNSNANIPITSELKQMFDGFWATYADRPLVARDLILKSICPQVFGLYIVKLAIAVVLAGGTHNINSATTGVRVRSEPHLLLVGDPGTGKSQLLRFASKIIPRSVLTTGIGSTAAGLTVTAIMENGEWQLEAGALVLADSGICCIDEFNTIKSHDRTSIHEAMEQQSISVAKAGIVCKLNTRCSILAATNPKDSTSSKRSLNMNLALSSPLLSRFDLILTLKDTIDSEWDKFLADYLLNFQIYKSTAFRDIHWTVECLQGYFSVIKKLNPLLTDKANTILGAYYQAQRKKENRNKARTTVRLLDSLVRLSQGHARLMYHSEVEVTDAVVAIILLETGMENDLSVFNLNLDPKDDFPTNSNITYKEMAKVILSKLQLNYIFEEEFKASTSAESHTSTENYVPGSSIQNSFFHTQEQKKLSESVVNEEAANSSNSKENALGKRKQSEPEKTPSEGEFGHSTKNTNNFGFNAVLTNKKSESVNIIEPFDFLAPIRKKSKKETQTHRTDAPNGKSEIANDSIPSRDCFYTQEKQQNENLSKGIVNNPLIESISAEKSSNPTSETLKLPAKSKLSRFKFKAKDDSLAIIANKSSNISASSSNKSDLSFSNLPQSTQKESLAAESEIKKVYNFKPIKKSLFQTEEIIDSDFDL